jgi:hypothetical protein
LLPPTPQPGFLSVMSTYKENGSSW